MNTMNTWLTGSTPAFGMSAPARIQACGGAVFGAALDAARVRHTDAPAIAGATPGTSVWSPPDC